MPVARVWTARIALAAMLFSAVSPALAAALFPGRADLLGRMLGIAADPAAAAQSAFLANGGFCSSEPRAVHERRQAGHDTHDEPGHSGHDILCSFCLAAGATVVLPPASGPGWALAAAAGSILPEPADAAVIRLAASSRHPRDPPLP